MNKEELDILNDVLYSESSWYVYDYQGFDYETIFPIIEKLIRINKEQEDRIDKAIEYITTEQLYTNYQWGKSLYAKILKDLLEILKGDNNDK